MHQPSLTIVIPCYNEALAITKVIQEYKTEFPDSSIVVINNASEDETEKLALEAGAIVLNECRKGKAQAMIKAFEEVQTDLMLMVDGDSSYPAKGARILLEHFLIHRSDMTTGIRKAENANLAFRPMHQWGNNVFALFVRLVFGCKTQDIFSGLRLFSKRLYKNMPIFSYGFELEMELTVQAIDKGFSWREIEIPFCEREAGTSSKLNTFLDGLRILRNLVVLFRDYKPLNFFCLFSACFFILGLGAGFPPVNGSLKTGLVERVPLAILAAALMNLSLFTLLTGMLSQSNLRYHREAFQIRIRQYTKKNSSCQKKK